MKLTSRPILGQGNASKKGKASGLRAFGDTNPSLTKIDHYVMIIRIPLVLLINLQYECSLEKRFPFPLNVICAYEEEDIVQLKI